MRAVSCKREREGDSPYGPKSFSRGLLAGALELLGQAAAMSPRWEERPNGARKQPAAGQGGSPTLLSMLGESLSIKLLI